MRSFTIDLEYFQNNGVLCVRPARSGVLSHLVRDTAEGHEEAWVFVNTDDEVLTDLRTGTYDMGQEFIKACRDMGLSVKSSGFFVPFSNGHNVRVVVEGEVSWKFFDSEINIVRQTPPNLEEILAVATH